jgi:thiol peroxidase
LTASRIGLDTYRRGRSGARGAGAAAPAAPQAQSEENNIMPAVRVGGTHLRGRPLDVTGEELKVGQKAPDFTLVGPDLSDVSLKDTSGKVRVISTVPSLDTPVCAIETRRWQEEADKLGDQVEIITVSMDLPFAQRRWRGDAGVSHRVLSAYSDESFGADWGVLIKDRPLRRVLQRAVFVLDKDDTVRYVQYVPEIAEQPDFDRALAEAAKLT